MIEGILLGSVGAILGLLLAPQLLKFLTIWISSGNSETPFTTSLDSTVLGFTIAATILVSLLFSLAPAAQFWKPDLLEAMRRHGSTIGAGGALNFRRTCVMLQIGLSLLLLVAAGLLVRTIRNLRTADIGLQTDQVATFQINPQFSGYNAAQSVSVRQRILDAISTIPGVRSVAATSDPELADDSTGGTISIAGYREKEEEDMHAELPFVTPAYFSTLGIPLLVGREFTPADAGSSAKVAVVNELFARHYFGSARNALGHYVGPGRDPKSMIVGVVKDSHHTNPRDPVVRTFFRPALQMGNDSGSPAGFAFYVRTSMPPASTINQLRQTIHNCDPKLVVDNLRTMNAQIDKTLLTPRVVAMLASSFGVIATLLAAIGLYGVLAYVTAQRTREIGIRMAVGAQPIAVAKLILREVLVLAAVSLAFAIPSSLLLGRVLRNQLFNVSATDLSTYAGSILIVTAVAVLAAVLPARRAAMVDPTETLRAE
jgi:predicted permease